MARCAYCGSTIALGGVKHGEHAFCNAECRENAVTAAAISRLPEDEVEQNVEAVHSGACPVCGGDGPVDVHQSYRIWSALIVTSYETRALTSCKSCGVKRKLGDLFYSLALGWWGRWGLFLTPVWTVRNLAALFKWPDPAEPSDLLRASVCRTMVSGTAREKRRLAQRRA